ncbi:MAG TPA: formate C-acetyltransferase/glycerol dehydratase family glycyl radical enzyme [Clostridiales bacterium]|jgi:formate C-acetyltransferase|nr:formate C-acetyltransferase/glycerol dehydratase family glycyl radical enzyme [Clostridiales bacterium]
MLPERDKAVLGEFSYDGGNHFPRIDKLLEEYWTHKPMLDIERAKIYTRVYRETEGERINIRRAKAFKAYLEEREIRDPGLQLIIGDTAQQPRAGTVCPEFHSGWLADEIDTIATRKQDPYGTTPEMVKELKEEIFPYWEGKTVVDHWRKQLPEWVAQLALKTGIVDADIKTQSPPGEVAPYWAMILKKGWGGFIKEAEMHIANLSDIDPEEAEKIDFYRGSIITMEAMGIYSRRVAEVAKKAARTEKDPKRKTELLRMAENCEWLATEPPRDFWEAIQFIWLILVGCMAEGNAPSYSPGRVDQLLWPYFEKDINEGKMTVAFALELIEAFCIKTAESTWLLSENAAMYFAGYQPFHTLNTGGIDTRGLDATNDLSYLWITAKMDVPLHAPSLCVRVHKGSPEHFLQHIGKLARMGLGYPAIYNDESAIKMMLLSGGTLEEARDWQIVGCVEPFISGKMAKWSDGGHYNFATAMEFALTNGRSLMNEGKLLGLETGDPRKMTFDEIKDAVKAQMAYLIEAISVCAHICERLYYEMTPFPYMSTLLDGTYQSGKDLTAGGVKYTYGPAFIGTGIADLVNSLSAIRKFVYEDKTITMDELIKALEANFEGYEVIHKMLSNGTPMYGNDIPEVDIMAGEFSDFAYEEIIKHKSFRGPHYISGLYPVSSHVPHGLVVGALPYGRKAGTPLADGLSPKGGTDLHGPTAVLKSVSKVNAEIHTAGTLLNMRLDPVSVKGDLGLKRISSLIRTLVDLNIYHIQFNVTNSEILCKAQKTPDKYRSLIIRVAGYSAYFTELCKEMQDDIIQRTIHQA